MTDSTNVPDAIPLDHECAFVMSIACAGIGAFPARLRKFSRLDTLGLPYAAATRQISPELLLSAAYIGVVLIPTSHRGFINEADRINKLEAHPLSAMFLTNAVAREQSAAGEYDALRGEFKRLLKHMDDLAGSSAKMPSFDAIANCKNFILQDDSPNAPSNREVYAEGSLHLWDFAKAVGEHGLEDMVFEVFNEWVLFAHLDNGIVSGHAVLPASQRFGNFKLNRLIDIDEIRVRDEDLFPILDVPKDVRDAVKSLSTRHFPGAPFQYYPPPMMTNGFVTSSTRIERVRLRPWTEE